jgi:copper(I)-binding protein
MPVGLGHRAAVPRDAAGPMIGRASQRMRCMVFRPAALALTLLLPAAALAHGSKTDDMRAGHSWAPPVDAPGPARVFVPLVNEGERARELVRVTTPIAGRAELRRGTDADAARLDVLKIDAGGMVNLARWREHIRLTQLGEDLSDGERFPLTLHFANHPSLELSVVVERQPGH